MVRDSVPSELSNNFPIAAGGIVVQPGDIIVGDLNGVVVVPQEMAVDLLERLRGRRAIEAQYKESVRRGEFSNAWVDRLLVEAGVQAEDGFDGPGSAAPANDGAA